VEDLAELNDQDEDEYESDPAPKDVQEDETEDIEVHEDENTEPEEVPRTIRSGRVVVKPTRFIEQEHVILHQTDKNSENYIEYSHDIAIVAARTIENFIHEVSQRGAAFAQQYILQKGLKNSEKRGKKQQQQNWTSYTSAIASIQLMFRQ
jgi:hypothetical protein